MSKEIIVVGGGAAGMMAAIAAGEQGASVKLLEPNERMGKKLNITGKGRCNVTNHADLETLLANIPRNGKFLYSAISRFGSRDTMAFFEGLGVPLKVERGERVFPVSDRAFDISAALERRLKALHVTLLRERAESLLVEENTIQGVKTDRGIRRAHAVNLATGGVSLDNFGDFLDAGCCGAGASSARGASAWAVTAAGASAGVSAAAGASSGASYCTRIRAGLLPRPKKPLLARSSSSTDTSSRSRPSCASAFSTASSSVLPVISKYFNIRQVPHFSSSAGAGVSSSSSS